MTKINRIILSSIPLAAIPLVSSAQATVNNLQDLIDLFKSILGWLMPLLVSLAVIYFIWGVLKYVLSAGDEEKQKEGRSMMIYGIIAIFVIVSVWGLVGVLVGTFGLSTTAQPVPVLP